MPIFQDASGLSVKFFIQKDLPQVIQAELCETITALGGRVDTKVPRQGYVLVQPGTAEEERLRLCWTSTDRPDRHFVPYSYVEACKIAGQELRQIFVHEGAPMKMFIHPSIANLNARAALGARIMHSGGDPTASEQTARVVLADPNTEIFQHLVRTHQSVPEKFVESFLWVKKCVERNAVTFTPLVYKNPGGRRPGEERTSFTEEDEEGLCQWVAHKIPYKDSGGRTGNKLYQQLVEMASEPNYGWVSRHTWQSWRERYKKNAVKLDVRIAQIVAEKQPKLGEKGQYGYVRQAEDKPKRSRRKKRGDTPEVDMDDSGLAMAMAMSPGLVANPAEAMRLVQENVYIPPAHLTAMTPIPGLPMGLALPGMMPPPMPHPEMAMTMHPGMHSQPSPGPSQGPMSLNGKAPEREEVEEADDGSQWAVRIGNDPPPVWGKRAAENETEEEENTRKRARAVESSRQLDQGIAEIAHGFRFTVEEVREVYERFGDMERTRNRFQSMRDALTRLFVDE